MHIETGDIIALGSLAVALCAALLPLVPVAMVAGRWGRGADG